MTALNQNVDMVRGDSRVLAFGPVLNEDDTYADLADAQAFWKLARSSTSGSELLTKDTGTNGGITIVSRTIDGDLAYTVEVELESDDTTGLAPSIAPARFYHECVVVDASGHVYTVAVGYFNLRPSIVPP